MTKPVILDGDATSHGGSVIASLLTSKWQNRKIACVGDSVVCPLCKGVFKIVDSGSSTMIEGKKIALTGMITECGALLIPSQTAYKAI